MNPFIEPEALALQLENDYDLGATARCELIRRGFNDTYHATLGNDRFILRVYLNGKYYISGPDDFRFELNLLADLQAHGLTVSYPLPGKTGGLLNVIPTSDGPRYYALFSVAPGDVSEEINLEQAAAWGKAIATFHLRANAFQSPHPRYHLNLKYLVDQPVELASQLLCEHGRGDLSRYLPRIDELKREILSIPSSADEYGIIHGDPHNRNVHFEGNRPTLFDFDHGGYGWRAYDLATSEACLSEESRRAFQESYESVRPLSPAESEAIPAFRKIRPLWDIGDVLAMKPAWGEPLGDEADCDRIFQVFDRLAQESDS